MKNEDLVWSVLSTEYIHRGNWATLRVDKCRMPDGRVKPEYYVLEYPDWACALAITEDKQVLLVRQYRHAAQLVSLELPGGVIEAGEDAATAIKRELLEETGYAFEQVELLNTIYANPATGNNRTHCFLALNGKKTQQQRLDEHEEIIIELYTIAELKQLIADKKIPQALHLATLLYALPKIEQL